ncbi:hypothetical protein [Streptomyces lateritius]|uniref:hypothetical protein n=1 Tax=Streptomyces lateritius TaxID=67313 RepID=UPI001C8C34A3|nr:hypothetical protein [Streptomyces lateritius]MBX9427528.1 hypothetical protein [Streptomyces lateritius]
MVSVFLVYLTCVGGGIAHVAYGSLTAALKGVPQALAFAPFSSWQDAGVLVLFLLVFTLVTFHWVKAYVSTATKGQMLIAFGAGWGSWGLVSPFLS